MKKSIFLIFAAILCAIGMNAATPEKLYLTPSSDWNTDNPRFAAYFFSDNGNEWVSMTKVAGETNLYEVTTPAGYPSVIFCRMNPNAAANNWDNKWNQTGDLAIPTDGKNHFTVPNGTWNGATTTWSTYTPASTEEPEVPTEPVKYTWTVAGTPASVFEVVWNPEHAANDMVEQADGTYKWEKTNIEFADESSSVQFKVCQEHAWTVAHPGSNYELNISGAGIYTVTITFNTNGNTVNAVATKTGEYVGEAPTHTYSVTGSNADLFGTAWDPAVEANLMETADNVTYTWEKEGVTLMGNFEMKVVQDKAFSVAYPAQNKVVKITEPAIYTVSITFNATSHDIDVNLTKTGEAVIPPVKLYFVNIGNWTDLKAYVWADGGNPYKAWEESESMTDTGDDVYGFDVYSYEFPSNYNRIIFKGANDQKTSDNAYDAAKPYYCNGVWYASLSEIPAPESLTYTVTVPEGTEECWIAGEMNNWTLTKMNPGAAANQFTLDIVGAAIDHEYKYACKNDWAYAEVREADENENSNRKAWTALDEVTAWGKPAVYTYYLMGVNGDWTTGIKMEVNTGAENEVMLTCQPVNGEIKIKRVGDDESEYWYGGKSLKEEEGNLGSNTESDTDGDGNIALEEGIYNFYFNTADGKLWIAAATDCATEETIELYDFAWEISDGSLLMSADWNETLVYVEIYNAGETLASGTYDAFLNLGGLAEASIDAAEASVELFVWANGKGADMTGTFVGETTGTKYNLKLTGTMPSGGGEATEYNIEESNVQGVIDPDGNLLLQGETATIMLFAFDPTITEPTTYEATVMYNDYSAYADGFVTAVTDGTNVEVSGEGLEGEDMTGSAIINVYFVGTILQDGAAVDVEVSDLVVESDEDLQIAMLSGTGQHPTLGNLTFELYLSNYTGDNAEYQLTSESKVYYIYRSMPRPAAITGSLTKSYSSELNTDVYAGTVTTTIDEQVYEINLTMYYIEPEAVDMTVTNATITLEDGTLFIEGEWNSYPFIIPEGLKDWSEDKQYQDINIEVGVWGENYYGMLMQDPTKEFAITVENNTLTFKGYFIKGDNEQLHNVTISGTMPTEEPEETPDYTRTVALNQWGTICLPNASSSFTGATFYEVSSLDPAKGLWLDQLAAGAQLEAGKPYIFQATATEIAVVYTGAAKSAPVAGENGLTGTFTDIAAGGVLVDNYIIANNAVWVANENNDLPANRAYINAALVPTETQAEIPGRRRVCMGENATTGLDQIVAPAGQAVKAIENGQLIIIRDGVKYNIQGQKL